VYMNRVSEDGIPGGATTGKVTDTLVEKIKYERSATVIYVVILSINIFSDRVSNRS
jgi:hypothetical protein